MVQVLGPVEREPSFAEKLSQGIGRGLEAGQTLYDRYMQMQQRQAEKDAVSRILGEDYANLSPEMQKIAFQETLKGKGALERDLLKSKQSQQKEGMKQQEAQQSLMGAMDVLNRMKMLREKGNLGVLSGAFGLINPETRQDRGEYEQLGKSLIQFSTNIPIRNRQEFETLAEKLYDPSLTDATAAGILDAMERIIANSMGPQEQETISVSEKITEKPVKTSKPRKDLSKFRL